MQINEFSYPPKDALFSLARSILFELDPEKAHDIALKALDNRYLSQYLEKHYHAPVTPKSCIGLSFPNSVGLAAGLDKNADYIDALAAIGFGHIEVGTVTPKAQAGNPKPRIFRLPQHQALINRLGFNNKGVDHLVSQASKRRFPGILGVNIGKNLATSLDDAHNDYLYCLDRVYPVADYVTVNISSPNTQGLRDLQHGDRLKQLLYAVKERQDLLNTEHQRYVPIIIKIAPDMTDADLDQFCTQIVDQHIDAVIAGNTTQDREVVKHHLYAREGGGLSGRPLLSRANDRLGAVVERLGSHYPVIGVGGINCGSDAQTKINLGASLVQIYTGFIYHGPALVRDCIECTQ